MTGFVTRVVARAIGREDSLAPRPAYRFPAAPVPGDSRPHHTEASSVQASSPMLVRAAAPDAAFRAETTSRQEREADHWFAPDAVSPRIDDAAGPGLDGTAQGVGAAQRAQAGAAMDFGLRIAGTPRQPGVAPDDAAVPWSGADGAEVRLLPLVAEAGRDAAATWPGLSPGDAGWALAEAGQPPRAPVATRAGRMREASSGAPEPPTIRVHIGRIDVRSVQAPAPSPPVAPKSRLQRPTLESVLRSRERGRS